MKAIDAARLSAPRSVSGRPGVCALVLSVAAEDDDDDDDDKDEDEEDDDKMDEDEEDEEEDEEDEDTDRCTVMASRTASNCRRNASRTSPSACVRRSNCCRAVCASSLCVRASSAGWWKWTW